MSYRINISENNLGVSIPKLLLKIENLESHTGAYESMIKLRAFVMAAINRQRVGNLADSESYELSIGAEYTRVYYRRGDMRNLWFEAEIVKVEPPKRDEYHLLFIFSDIDLIEGLVSYRDNSRYNDVQWARAEANTRIGAILDALYPHNMHDIHNSENFVVGYVTLDNGRTVQIVACKITKTD